MFLRNKVLAALAVGAVAGFIVLLIWGDLLAAGVVGGIWSIGMFLVLCGGGVAAPHYDDECLGDDNAQMAATRRSTSDKTDRLA